MGLATYLLISLRGTIHHLIGIVLGVSAIKIVLRSVFFVLPPAMDQGKCIGSKILSRL